MAEKTQTKVKVTCVVSYNDLKLKRLVKKGEVLTVTKDRAEELKKAKVAE